jgi:hypothetical protein
MKYTICCLLIFTFGLLQAQVETPAETRDNVRLSWQEPTDLFISSIAVSDSGVQHMLLWLDSWQSHLSSEAATGRASNLNLSKSNVDRKSAGPIDKTREALIAVSDALANLKNGDPMKRGLAYMDLNTAVDNLDGPTQELYRSILNRGEKDAAQAGELIRRHDTVKSSINNIRS